VEQIVELVPLIGGGAKAAVVGEDAHGMASG
jgi:hypothetical protein